MVDRKTSYFIDVLSISASGKCETLFLDSVSIRLKKDILQTRYQQITVKGKKSHIEMHIIEKKPNMNKNGLKLIFVRINEMFQQYLFSLSNHQAYNIQYRFITLGTTTTKLDCLYIVFFKIPTPYRNLTAPFLCFQLQFVSIAPLPRLVYSDNSSPRYTWYRARGCRRK